MKKRVLLLPISGLLGSAVRNLYDECAGGKLQDAFPNLKVACIGTPFPNAPFPLLDAKHLLRDPEAQVIRSWSRMIEFGFASLEPAILKGADIVICRRLGLDIVLFASACQKWNTEVMHDGKLTTQGQRAMDWHHIMVRRFLNGELGIRVPDAYILPMAQNGDGERILFDTFPDLKNLPPQVVHNFLERKKQIIEAYFDPATGQNQPLIVDAMKPANVMLKDVIDFIRRLREVHPQ